jgi:hypothetical protein
MHIVCSYCPELTLGHVLVPHAIAATAWAPPALRMCVAPAFFATYSTSCGRVTVRQSAAGRAEWHQKPTLQMLPSLPGGVATIMVLHPAMAAG